MQIFGLAKKEAAFQTDGMYFLRGLAPIEQSFLPKGQEQEKLTNEAAASAPPDAIWSAALA